MLVRGLVIPCIQGGQRGVILPIQRHVDFTMNYCFRWRRGALHLPAIRLLLCTQRAALRRGRQFMRLTRMSTCSSSNSGRLSSDAPMVFSCAVCSPLNTPRVGWLSCSIERPYSAKKVARPSTPWAVGGGRTFRLLCSRTILSLSPNPPRHYATRSLNSLGRVTRTLSCEGLPILLFWVKALAR